MNAISRISQAYSQAPWRKQVQYIGIFLLVLIIGMLVAGIYLSITARAATIGRSIQTMYRDKNYFEREIENLKTQLAFMTSNAEMQRRAIALGFHPRNQDEVIYLVVPGYFGRQPNTNGVKTTTILPTASMPSGEYTQSLLDWLKDRILEPGISLMEVKP